MILEGVTGGESLLMTCLLIDWRGGVMSDGSELATGGGDEWLTGEGDEWVTGQGDEWLIGGGDEVIREEEAWIAGSVDNWFTGDEGEYNGSTPGSETTSCIVVSPTSSSKGREGASPTDNGEEIWIEAGDNDGSTGGREVTSDSDSLNTMLYLTTQWCSFSFTQGSTIVTAWSFLNWLSHYK